MKRFSFSRDRKEASDLSALIGGKEQNRFRHFFKLLPGLLQPRQLGIEIPGAKTPAAQAADE
jgi:hypothetical protein